MTDPLDYMNQLTRWSDPPKYSKRWAIKLAHACEMISERDAEIEKLQAENERLRDALKEIMRSPKCINPSCTIDNPLCNTMIAVAALKGGDE